MLIGLVALFTLGLASSALADRNFSVRFSANDTGDIAMIANGLMTCPSSDNDCDDAQNAAPTTQNGDLHNNNFNMQYIDVDGDSGTFNSSTANQSLPAGSQVLFAGLYWGGDRSGAPDPADRDRVKLKVPGSNSYVTIDADTLDDSQANPTRYQAFADVTDIVAALPNSGNGTYTVADVQAGRGSDKYAGWTLVVAYRNTSEPARNLTVFDGLRTIVPNSAPTNIPVSGFLTPPTGPVNVKVGFVAWEGDHTLVGDGARLNGQTLGDAQHPSTNFFNSRISRDGALFNDRNPTYANTLGMDAAITDASGNVGNNATSATIQVITAGDQYLPGVITFAIDIFAPKVEQSKSVTDDDGGEIEPGDTLTYKISGKNNGQDGTSNFVLRDPIPANTTYVPGSLDVAVNDGGATGAQSDASGDDLAEFDAGNGRVAFRLGAGATAAQGGNVRPGDEYEVTFKVKVNGPDVNPIVPGTEIENTATATFLSESTGTPLSAVSSTEVTATAPDLRIDKSRTGGPIVAGGTSEYTLEVDNHGDAPTQGTVTVSDPLPAGVTATAISGDGWSCNATPADSVECSRTDALAPGEEYPPIVIAVSFSDDVADEVANTATVSGGGDGNLGDNTSEDRNPASRVADLELEKTASKDSVTIGETFSYDLKVTNHGPSRATSVAITDPLPNGLTFVSASPAPGCVVQPPSGVLACEVGTLASGQSHTVTVQVSVDPDAAGNDIVNTARVDGAQTDPDPSNDEDGDTVSASGADLAVSKDLLTADEPVTGDQVRYQVKVENLGPSVATDVVLHDALPSGLGSVSTDNPAQCTVAAGAVDCQVGTLTVGQAFVIEVQGTVLPGQEELLNRASATGAENDPDPSNNEDEVTTPVGKSADLSITKDADPDTVEPGGTVLYTFVVQNHGPDAADGIVVTDTLPDGITYVDGAPGCSAAGQVVTCSVNPIAAGGSRQTGITVRVSEDAEGTIHNVAAVKGNQPDPDPSDDQSSTDTPIVGVADVEILKQVDDANPRPGDEITYTLTARNVGTADAEGVVVSDTLPPGLTFVSADAPCVQNAGTITCDLGTLEKGEEVNLRVRAKVEPWGDADPNAKHLLDVQKVETQIDLEPGEEKTVAATCPAGYFASDGSVRVDHVDQGTGSWTSPQVLESRASDRDTWQGTVRNTASGRAQAKVFAVCIKDTTLEANGHSHELIVSDPITVSHDVLAGKDEAVLQCGPGQIAIQPGFTSNQVGHMGYSQPEGNGWKFVFDVEENAQVTYSIRCLTRQVSFVDGHTHDLSLQRITTEVEIGPGAVNEAQLTCPDGSKGIVAGWDLDDGLVSLGNDPRPVTRAFKLYNPTDEPLKARLSLLCLGDMTGGEHVGPKDIVNTASISTESDEDDTGNNQSSVTFTAEDTDNHDPVVVDPDPDKPVVNNPTGGPIVGSTQGSIQSSRVSLRGAAVTVAIRCSGPCAGVAKLNTTRKAKLGGKTLKKGALLAKSRFSIGEAGVKKVKLKATKNGKRALKSGKVKKALLTLTGGTKKVVRVAR